MSEAMKPTPGPWVVAQYSAKRFGLGTAGHPEMIANARLIAEAGTVHHTTGLSPMQLVERVKELEHALRKIIEMNQQWAEDQWGDANKAESMSCVRVARAALSKSQG
jgi:hypothetical protein